jgi:hypothetical protein
MASTGQSSEQDRQAQDVDAIPTLAWSARPDGSVEFLNRRWLDYTGLSIEEAPNWGWTAALHPEDRDRLMGFWRHLLDSGEDGEIEARLRRRWRLSVVPEVRLAKMLTFERANVDIYIEASAPVIAWLSTRGRMGLKLALVWNVLGLPPLTNVVIRAVLTAPGPFNLVHAEVPNRIFGTFPFVFIPGFFVPLTVTLHVLAIRAISNRLRIGIGIDLGRLCFAKGSKAVSV